MNTYKDFQNDVSFKKQKRNVQNIYRVNSEKKQMASKHIDIFFINKCSTTMVNNETSI